MRANHELEEKFIRVTIASDANDRAYFANVFNEEMNKDLLDKQVASVLENGLELVGIRFDYFQASASQVKSKQFYFVESSCGGGVE